ncbi:MAG: hypothetical protein ABR599_04000 [Gemmatimonadota bacterium]
MTVEAPPLAAPIPGPRRPAVGRAAFGVQHLIPLGIFAQAVLAGLFLYVDRDLLAWHNGLGTVLPVIGLAVLVLATMAGFPARTRLVGLAAVQLVLLVVQHAVGLLGRESAHAAAFHVPHAFLLFTVAMLWLVRARRALRGAA